MLSIYEIRLNVMGYKYISILLFHLGTTFIKNVNLSLITAYSQDKLYEELSEALRCNGSDDFDMTTLAELQYLNGVIKGTVPECVV